MIIKDKSLPKDALDIIRHQATESPHFDDNKPLQNGTYLCRACGTALFRSHSKFNSSCGWPSFDEALQNTVLEQMDPDGQRVEIVCGFCLAHLGHVFDGEGFTAKNRRYCVNAKSLDFIENSEVLTTEEAILAGGCFWGVESRLAQLAGVVHTEVGFIGGVTLSPTYEEVCAGNTGHFEAVRVLYDPQKLSYDTLLHHFFDLHDPTQVGGQGPDQGDQYRSAIFYYNETQKNIALQQINLLQKKMPVVTKLLPVTPFWPAESYHQHYYCKKNQ